MNLLSVHLVYHYALLFCSVAVGVTNANLETDALSSSRHQNLTSAENRGGHNPSSQDVSKARESNTVVMSASHPFVFIFGRRKDNTITGPDY